MREEEERRVAEQARKRIAKGVKCSWSLTYSESAPQHTADVACVAIGGGGFCAVDNSGNVFFHGVPDNVYDILKRQQFKNVDYVAIGRNGQYFLQKQNGRQYMGGLPSNLEESIREHGSVKTLVLGGSYQFFVQFSNGRVFWSGLSDKVNSIIRINPVVSLWIGDNDSIYYLKYSVNGTERCSYKNLPYKMQKYATNTSMNIRQMLYDKDTDTCFVRYNDA